MMSCETKENFRGIEKHLEIDHPDLFVLYKRDLQGKILIPRYRRFLKDNFLQKISKKIEQNFKIFIKNVEIRIFIFFSNFKMRNFLAEYSEN